MRARSFKTWKSLAARGIEVKTESCHLDCNKVVGVIDGFFKHNTCGHAEGNLPLLGNLSAYVGDRAAIQAGGYGAGFHHSQYAR